MIYIKDNINVSNTGFTHNGVVYTAGTLAHLTDEQLLDIGITKQAPETAPAPVYKTQFTSLEYLEKFTEAEQLAVVSATIANAQVKLLYDKMLAASFIDLQDPRTIGGLSALVAVGLLTEERKTEILTPEIVA